MWVTGMNRKGGGGRKRQYVFSCWIGWGWPGEKVESGPMEKGSLLLLPFP